MICASRFFRVLNTPFTRSPPSSDPNISSPRGYHMFSVFWRSSIPKFPPSMMPATAIAFMRVSAAARWYDSSRNRIQGIERAIALRICSMDSLDDLLVEPGQGASVELLVHHPVLLDRAEFRRGLRADDLEGRHELRVRHLLRGPEAVRQVARRGRRADDLLREARESVRLRHDDTQARHRRLRLMPGPV